MSDTDLPSCVDCVWKTDKGMVLTRLDTMDKMLGEVKTDVKVMASQVTQARLDIKGLTVRMAIFAAGGGGLVAVVISLVKAAVKAAQ